MCLNYETNDDPKKKSILVCTFETVVGESVKCNIHGSDSVG